MLATDDYFAPRRCLLAPLPEHEIAADLLSQAADAVVMGDLTLARARLEAADMPVLYAYARKLMDTVDAEIHRRRPVPRTVSVPVKAAARMPNATETLALYERDGWRCRFCGCRVVFGRARSAIRACLPESVRWSEANGFHGAFFAMSASVDHVIPHSAGGGNDLANLVTACWSCQFGRGAYAIEELGLIDPRSRAPVVDAWDGLSRVLGRIVSAKPPQREKIRPQSPPDAIETQRIVASKAASTPSILSLTQENWLAEFDARYPTAARRMIEFLDSCNGFGVSWTVNKKLLARMRVADNTIAFLAVEPDGRIQLPWSIGENKTIFAAFAETVADAIPGAIAYETPKLWNVSMANGRRVTIDEILEALPALREAIRALNASMRSEPK